MLKDESVKIISNGECCSCGKYVLKGQSGYFVSLKYLSEIVQLHNVRSNFICQDCYELFIETEEKPLRELNGAVREFVERVKHEQARVC